MPMSGVLCAVSSASHGVTFSGLVRPAVQQVYRDYLLAVQRKLHPEFIGLVAETNLIRAAAPSLVYDAVVQAANDAAADLRTAGSPATFMLCCHRTAGEE